jgi:nucleoside-diphosphate-sugar epimerase
VTTSLTSISELEDRLSEPTTRVIDSIARGAGDLIVLGAAGKMGPTLARMAQRAVQAAGVRRRVVAVSRFSTPGAREAFEARGLQTIACDLLDRAAVAALPDAGDVVFMAGMKFGATGRAALTWAENCLLPGYICERYSSSRIVAFSTGNVYGLVPAGSGGSRETDDPAPAGEYAMSCLGRERIFEYFSQTRGVPTSILRLNYACELRYGVLVDLATRVAAGDPIDLTMGYLNAIWQGDANAVALCAFDGATSPPAILNVAGLDELSVRSVALSFGRLLRRSVTFSGQEAPDALLSDGRKAAGLFGAPQVSPDTMIRWIAEWQMAGGATLGKPTRFEVRDGRF